MILWLFCIIIFYEITCNIDTNHNEIYLCTVSPWWSCSMMFAFCVNGHEFEFCQSVLEHGRWSNLVEGAEMWSLWCLKSKWWCHFLYSEGNHVPGLKSWDHRLWGPQCNAPKIQCLHKFRSALSKGSLI